MAVGEEDEQVAAVAADTGSQLLARQAFGRVGLPLQGGRQARVLPTRSRMPASIGSNQAPANSSPVPSAPVVVLCSSMAWSPPALQRRPGSLLRTGNYATNQFHHIRDGTIARANPPLIREADLGIAGSSRSVQAHTAKCPLLALIEREEHSAHTGIMKADPNVIRAEHKLTRGKDGWYRGVKLPTLAVPPRTPAEILDRAVEAAFAKHAREAAAKEWAAAGSIGLYKLPVRVGVQATLPCHVLCHRRLRAYPPLRA